LLNLHLLLDVIQSLPAGVELTHHASAGTSPGSASLIRFEVRHPSQFLRCIAIEFGTIARRKPGDLLIEYSITDCSISDFAAAAASTTIASHASVRLFACTYRNVCFFKTLR
jgi:hypothetical protein